MPGRDTPARADLEQEVNDLRAQLAALNAKLGVNQPAPADSTTRTAAGRAAKVAGYEALAKAHEAKAQELDAQAKALAESKLEIDVKECRRLQTLAKSERGAAAQRRHKIAILQNQE